jgi:hypothetical protein
VGSPYTTETELGSEDEFLILACDGVSSVVWRLSLRSTHCRVTLQLWDITGDQGAIDLVRHIPDAQTASDTLVKHALDRQSNDNVTVLVVRFKPISTQSVWIASVSKEFNFCDSQHLVAAFSWFFVVALIFARVFLLAPYTTNIQIVVYTKISW